MYLDRKIKAFTVALILAIITLNFFILRAFSKLDMFDFFNMLYKIISIGQLLFSAVLFVLIIILYFEYYKHKINEIVRNAESERNRKYLNTHLEIVLKSLKNLELLIKNEVINNKSIKEKLSNTVKALNFDSDFKKNAIFNSVMDILVDKIASNYTAFKTKKIDLDYFAIEEITKEMKNIISANQYFKVDTNYIIGLTRSLLNDFARKKSINKNLDSKVLILEYFKTLSEKMYKSFQDNKEVPASEIEKEYQKMSNSTVSGNENTNIQDLKSREININFNK